MEEQACFAAYYLMETHNRPHRNQRMRVVFLVQEPSIWDKQSDVYDVFDKDPEVDVMMVVMPSYDAIDTMAGNKQGRYDPKIWHYFSSRYHHVYAFTNIQSLRVLRPDYVFFDRPYEGLRPMEGLRAADVAQFSKICYISYGTQGLKLFIHMEMGNPSFFSYVSYYFCDSDEEKTSLSSAYPFAGQGGVQHFEALGYPGFQSYLSARVERNPVRRILWTPRWSLDENIGGSHFFDYKDAFIEFALRHQSNTLQFAVRPHPLMFPNFVQQGNMSAAEVEAYKKRLRDSGIELDEGEEPPFDALLRTDILLTDFSSIVMNFFLLNRPLIYCPHGPALTDDYERMAACSYVAEDWGQIEERLEMLISGSDPAAEQRTAFVEEMRLRHDGAAKRIVGYLKGEYRRKCEPIYSATVEKMLLEKKKEMLSFLLQQERGTLRNMHSYDWYDYYLELLPIRLHDFELRQEERQLLEQLVCVYENDEVKNGYLMVAMLLLAEPMGLPIPLEVDQFSDVFIRDMKSVFERDDAFV